MKVAFFSNYLSPHQIPFSEAMYNLLGTNYAFVSCAPYSVERQEMGWQTTEKKVYELRTYASAEDDKRACEIARDWDVMIWGSANLKYVKMRVASGKMHFRYSERLFKQALGHSLLNLDWLRYIYYNFKTYSPREFLLSASAYAPTDFYFTLGRFKQKYKWGYFPATKIYDLEKLFAQKSAGRNVSILWAGRFIGWKHPEVAILLAKKLKQTGCSFTFKLIGCGPLENLLKDQIRQYALGDCVRLLGAMPPAQVRTHMEQADIFLFTSDFNEGWGAVLNESMNSACAVVASHAIGSVPFLLKPGENGFIYKNGSLDDLYQKTVYLIEHPQERLRIGKAAYQTITQLWNAETAAKRFLVLYEYLKEGKSSPFREGPCSSAQPILQKDMYDSLTHN